MSKAEKLRKRLLSKPSDFTWNELVKLLMDMGYTVCTAGKTSGSRVRFIHNSHEPIMLHKPHPTAILKRYQVKQLVTTLRDRKQL